MDEFLATVGVQAMKYAIRSGIALTSTYALGQCSRLLKSIDDKELFSELNSLQKLLDSKMKVLPPSMPLKLLPCAYSSDCQVLAPVIDLIELK